MASFPASAVAVVNISLMKMVTVMVTVVTAELESTGRRTTMKKVTLELLIDENGDEDINPIKSEIESALQRCYHDMKLVSYEEEKLDVRWFCAKDVTPPVPEYGMCSEDVIVKYKDGTESVACITFNGVWYDTDYNEVADVIVYWRYMTDDEMPN
jgi:hypothetical protein|nr:MAG TPA: hypothetical protein [Bacteriophage sp.]